MAKYNVHGGHNSIVPGAASILNEVTEDRKVKNKLISLLKGDGHTAYDCTDDVGKTSGANLANIVAKCNKHTVDYDISIHLNSGRKDSKGDGKTGGVEIFIYDNDIKDIAKAVADAIADEFGYTLRSDSTTPAGCAGVKISKGLYVLRNTKARAMLIECCFVDDKDDAKVWNAEKCAAAIYKGLTGKAATSTSDGTSGTSADHGGTPGHYWATMRMEYLNYSNEHRWIAHKHSDNTYSLKNVEATTYMSVRDGKTEENQEVWAYSWNETKSQRFVLEQAECSEITSCVYLKCASDNDYVVASDGEKMCIQKKKGNFAQRWVLIPTGLEDEYYILNYGSAKSVGVKYK